jgi:DNA-binding NarL/FixJ family response regulator
MRKKKIKLAVTDDQQLFRRGLISLLGEFDELQVTLEAVNGKNLLEQLKNKYVDVVLLDYEMPGMDGAETAAMLREKYPEIKILILTMHNDEEIILHMVEKGAHGFLLKDYDIEIVVDAIYAVMENGYYFNPSISKTILKNLVENKKIKPSFKKGDELSEREIEILQMICAEFTSKEIAEKLFIAGSTVNSHKESILKKTGARNVAGMVLFAVKNGLIKE